MSSNERIVLLDGARTPIGSFGGDFKDVPGFELGAMAVKSALHRSGVETSEIDEVVMGCIRQVGPNAYNARRVAMAAGLPESAPAYTVIRLCGSGLQAIRSAATQMRWGGVDFAVAGGSEPMTRMPFSDFGARNGHKLGHRALVDGTVAILTDPFSGAHMGVTAENVARHYNVPREEQDEIALESQRRAATGAARAAFAEEITPGHRRTQTTDCRHRRTPQTIHHPGDTCRAAAGLPGRQYCYRRQRLGHPRRCRRLCPGPGDRRRRAGPGRAGHLGIGSHCGHDAGADGLSPCPGAAKAFRTDRHDPGGH
ncbi:acetyl-CoA acetyltransferase [Pseudarthrobacter sp. SLBN-100]